MTEPTSTPQVSWDATLYERQHDFVWHYGAELLDILAPKRGELILDLGCGTGQLTEQIAASGATVTGLDNSPTMIEQAQKNYPNLDFVRADAANFSFEHPFDAVFSNAALHWIQQPEAVIKCIWQSLKPGGRFVAEFGGKGNVQQISLALETITAQKGYFVKFPWYFPSIGEYAALLEKQGFEVHSAALFDRPTPLEAGERGMENWVKMFGNLWLSVIPEPERKDFIEQVEVKLRPHLYQEGTWLADYRRLRIAAKKI